MTTQSRIQSWCRAFAGRHYRLFNSTWERFGEVEGAEAAAAIAFYAIFSVFPLLIFVVALSGTTLRSPDVQTQILGFFAQFVPGSEDLIRANIEQVVLLRGPIGFFGMIALLWSATGVFAGVAQNINQAWHTSRPRHFLVERVLAIVMIIVLCGLLGMGLVTTTFLQLVMEFDWPIIPELYTYQTMTWGLVFKLVPLMFIFLSYYLLYKLTPNTVVRRSEALYGALFATVGWEVVKAGFLWYLKSGLAGFHLLYGSLGAVVAFMFWVYLCSLLTLLGANLSATIAFERQKRAPRVFE